MPATSTVSLTTTGMPCTSPRAPLRSRSRVQLARPPISIGIEVDHRVVLAANEAMTLLYADIGKAIPVGQEREGWGTGTVDRLSHDLREAFPDMRGFSPRNLKYMRAFAAAWPKPDIVQRTVAQVPWRSNLALLHKLDIPETRIGYARKAIEQGWSREILELV